MGKTNLKQVKFHLEGNLTEERQLKISLIIISSLEY